MNRFCAKLFVCLGAIAMLLSCANAAPVYNISSKSPIISPSLQPIVAKYRRGDYVSTMLDLKELLKKEPQNAYANYYMGLTYAQLGDKEKAYKYYNNVIDINSNISLTYYAKKALVCGDDPYSTACTEFGKKPAEEPTADDKNAQEEDDDITKFIKSGKKVHPAAADAITKERMERKLQEDEYRRRQAAENLSNVPTKEEIIAAYDVLKRAGLEFNSEIKDLNLAFNPYGNLNDNNAINMFILNQALQEHANLMDYGI